MVIVTGHEDVRGRPRALRNANDICFEQVETNEVEICLSTNHVRAGLTTAEPPRRHSFFANNELENSAEPVAREGFRTR